MDLATITLEVRARLGELAADFFQADEVLRAINEAVKRFSQEERWPWLLTEWSTNIVAGADSLDLPSNVSFNRVFNLSLSGTSIQIPVELERLTPQAGFRQRHTYSTFTGVPRWYYIHATNQDTDGAPPVIYTVRLIPMADVDYDVEAQYLTVPFDLTGDSDEPMVPEEYQEAIVAWATGKLFLKEFQISQKANEQFAIYQRVLEQAKQEVFQPSIDEKIVWGREFPGEHTLRTEDDYVRGRIPPTLG